MIILSQRFAIISNMRKIIFVITLFVFLFFVMPARADMMPLSTKSIRYYGVGVLNMPKNYSVYAKPDKDAIILQEVDYKKMKNSAIVKSSDMHKYSYIAYIPSSDVAFLTVENNLGNGWYNVYINQQTGETGWVYNENEDDFYTYRTLFYKYGKKYGLRIFNDIPREQRVLYAKQSKESQVLDKLTYPKYITFTVIMGNWLLISVNDTSKYAKVGWFNWRNDDGTLNMFPNLKEQR